MLSTDMPMRERENETDGTGSAELRLDDVRYDANAAGALSGGQLIFTASMRCDENRCAFHPSADQGIVHDGASGRNGYQ
jgi:hypothetical protein